MATRERMSGYHKIAALILGSLIVASLSACYLTWKEFSLDESKKPIAVHGRFEVSAYAHNFPWGRRDVSNFYLSIYSDVVDSALASTTAEPDTVVMVNSVLFRTDCMTEPIALECSKFDYPKPSRPYSMGQSYGVHRIEDYCANIHLSFNATLYSIKEKRPLESVPVELVIERHHSKTSPMF